MDADIKRTLEAALRDRQANILTGFHEKILPTKEAASQMRDVREAQSWLRKQ